MTYTTAVPAACQAILTLEPTSVFKAFAQISAIPRCSGDEQAISDFLVGFARHLGLFVHQDKALNVMIKKPGTPGYESAPTVILQGHMDMVCEKTDTSSHNFETDPIELRVDGDTLTAHETSLGADNGIAVAYAMAILASKDIPHPPLEVVITTNEEVGLVGATQLDTTPLQGKILINLDAEDEGRFFVSCAGGTRCSLKLPIDHRKADDGLITVTLTVDGLKGGHSGMDINQGLGNANKLMGRALEALHGAGAQLVEVSGGGKANAIPRSAWATLLVAQERLNEAKDCIKKLSKTMTSELTASDPGLSVTLVESIDASSTALPQETFQRIVDLYRIIPSGVQTMSQSIDGLVESSLNLGVVKQESDTLVFHCAVRSSVESLKHEICGRLESLARCMGAEFVTGSSYPAWEYQENSAIRKIMTETYTRMYGKAPEICAIHAGLECGILGEALKGLDMIALGPDMRHVHSPDETLSIGSVKRTWEFLCEVLKNVQ